MTASTYSYTTNRKCSDCGHKIVTRAQRSGVTDGLLSAINIYPYRCHHHTCGDRHYRFGKK
jgi:hypothetical protein